MVTRFNLSWNIEAKFKEISEYASKVLAFVDLYQGKPIYTQTTLAPTPPPKTTSVTTQPTTTTTTTTTNNTNTGTSVYVIVSGDSGFGIARKLNVTFTDLQNANPGVDWGRLSIGQRINIPGRNWVHQPTAPPPTTTFSSTYTVVSGDIGSRIAQKLGVSFSELQSANPGVDWNRLSIGQRLNVPGKRQVAPTPPPVTTTYYTVVSGDTGMRIAQKLGVNFPELQNANPAVNWNRLAVGQRLVVPRR